MKQGDIVRVHWLDQSSYTGPCEADGAIQDCNGQSVGIFLEQSKEWIAIASERFETDRIAYRHIMTFPRCAVLKVEIILRAKGGGK